MPLILEGFDDAATPLDIDDTRHAAAVSSPPPRHRFSRRCLCHAAITLLRMHYLIDIIDMLRCCRYAAIQSEARGTVPRTQSAQQPCRGAHTR